MATVIIKRTTDYAGAVNAMMAENDWLQSVSQLPIQKRDMKARMYL